MMIICVIIFLINICIVLIFFEGWCHKIISKRNLKIFCSEKGSLEKTSSRNIIWKGVKQQMKDVIDR